MIVSAANHTVLYQARLKQGLGRLHVPDHSQIKFKYSLLERKEDIGKGGGGAISDAQSVLKFPRIYPVNMSSTGGSCMETSFQRQIICKMRNHRNSIVFLVSLLHSISGSVPPAVRINKEDFSWRPLL